MRETSIFSVLIFAGLTVLQLTDGSYTSFIQIGISGVSVHLLVYHRVHRVVYAFTLFKYLDQSAIKERLREISLLIIYEQLRMAILPSLGGASG